MYMYVEKNPVNPVTNGPQKFGGINRMAVLKGFIKENDSLSFCSKQNKLTFKETSMEVAIS